MRKEEILNLPSMPLTGGYPRGPYRFINREYFIVVYESDPEIIRKLVPEPLTPDGSNNVMYEFIFMPDSSGFGHYTESGIVIPCVYEGKPVNFTLEMYLDCEPPISAGREIWGFPKKHAKPSLQVIHDTLTGKLEYAGQLVALGTMNYKHNNLLLESDKTSKEHENNIKQKLTKTQVNLKLIPHVDGSLAIAQLVAYEMCDIVVKGAWQGDARLHLVPHVNAPIADLPVRHIVTGLHFIADATLPYGRVLFDYKK